MAAVAIEVKVYSSSAPKRAAPKNWWQLVTRIVGQVQKDEWEHLHAWTNYQVPAIQQHSRRRGGVHSNEELAETLLPRHDMPANSCWLSESQRADRHADRHQHKMLARCASIYTRYAVHICFTFALANLASFVLGFVIARGLLRELERSLYSRIFE